MPKPKNQSPDPDPGEPNIDMSMFEQSGALGAVNSEFADLTTSNRSEIDMYSRDDFDLRRQLGLTITPELEQSESQVCNMKRSAMIKELGMEDATRRDGGDYVQFDEIYKDGATQVKYVRGATGGWIGVRTDLIRTGDGRDDYAVSSIILLSDREVVAETRVLQEHGMDQRLQKQFGLTSEFIEKSGLSFDDKQGMLESYDKVQTLDLAPADLSKLDKLRGKLTKGIMPTRKGFRKNKADQAVIEEEYLSQLHKLASDYDQHSQEYQNIFQREQLLRLRSLNERLDKRRTLSKWLGRSATAGLTAGFSSLGAMAGVIAEPHAPEVAAGTGAVLGAGLGLLAIATGPNGSFKDRKNRRKRSERGFDAKILPETGQNVKAALQSEHDLAQRYFKSTTFYQS